MCASGNARILGQAPAQRPCDDDRRGMKVSNEESALRQLVLAMTLVALAVGCGPPRGGRGGSGGEDDDDSIGANDDDAANDDDVSGCSADEIEDCNNNCAPAEWLGDGSCDDGDSEYSGEAIVLDCAELDHDDGDCESPADDDDDDDDDQVAHCFDLPLSCPSGLPALGASGEVLVEAGTTQFAFDESSGWSCSEPIFLQVAPGTQGLSFRVSGTPYLADLVGPGGNPTLDLPLQPLPMEIDGLIDIVEQGLSAEPPWGYGFTGENAQIQWPMSPASTPQVGCTAIRLALSEDQDGLEMDWEAVVNRVPAPTRVDVHAVRSAGAQISEAEVMDAIAHAFGYFDAAAGLQLGDLTFQSISNAWDSVDIVNGAPALFATGSGGPTGESVQVYFIRDIADSGVIGLSGGIPGALAAAGKPSSGVMVETLWTDGEPDYLAQLGLDIAHEVGHFLGLRHTTEIDGSNGWTHDRLTDTAECENGGSDDAISPGECPAASENVMFPILESPATAGFSSQQATVLASVLPYAEVDCTTSASCGPLEICSPVGRCEFGYSRWYTLYLDSVAVAATGPSGAWDIAGGAPDPLASWACGAQTGSTLAVSNSYTATWFDSFAVYVAATTPVAVSVYDSDLSVSDLIDWWPGQAPVPITELRNPYFSWTGTYSTLELGFEPL